MKHSDTMVIKTGTGTFSSVDEISIYEACQLREASSALKF